MRARRFEQVQNLISLATIVIRWVSHAKVFGVDGEHPRIGDGESGRRGERYRPEENIQFPFKHCGYLRRVAASPTLRLVFQTSSRKILLENLLNIRAALRHHVRAFLTKTQAMTKPSAAKDEIRS